MDVFVEWVAWASPIGWVIAVLSISSAIIQNWGHQSRMEEYSIWVNELTASTEAMAAERDREVDNLRRAIHDGNETYHEREEEMAARAEERRVDLGIANGRISELEAELERELGAHVSVEQLHANAERLGVNNLPFGIPSSPFFRVVEPHDRSVDCPHCTGEIRIHFIGDAATNEEVRSQIDGRSMTCEYCDRSFTYKHVSGDGDAKPLWDRYTPMPASIHCWNLGCDGGFDITYVGLKDYLDFVDWLPGKEFRCAKCGHATLGDDYKHPEA